MSKTLIKNIRTLYTSKKLPPVKGKDMSDIYELDNAYILIEDEYIKEIGTDISFSTEDMFIYDAKGLICIPGLIDSHTHLVFGGSREHEFAKKIAGVPYLEILKQGGGIHSTVEQTKKASYEELFNQAKKSLNEMLLFGVTTLEAKSGYGLDIDTEIKQLYTVQVLNETHPIDIKSTFLGAHALPKEFASNRDEFIDNLIEALPSILEKGLAEYVDVFCETGVFTAKETEKIFKAAKEIGFKLRLHSDEIDSIGGTEVGIKYNAKSVDHLMAITDEDISKLSKSNTIANILPATSFFLNKKFAPARKMIDNGCAVSVSSDYNPGSTPSENYQLTLQLAGNKLRMLPKEILTASTINPAYSLDVNHLVGSLEVGKLADIVLLDAKNLDYFIYHYGINHTKAVFKNGKLVVDNRTIIEEKK